MVDSALKKHIYQRLAQVIDKKVETARLMVKSTEESRNSETKSSVGDKHETGRAMMQREEEQHRAQLANTLELKNILTKIDMGKAFSKVEFGSLVMTSQGTYFLSIGLGEIEVGEKKYFAISPASPLGQALLNKVVGDKVLFLDKDYVIAEIA